MAYCILKSYKLKLEPFKIFEVFQRYNSCFFLDSSLNSNSIGRFSFFGIEPFFKLSINTTDPFNTIRAAIERYKIPSLSKDIPFLGGAVGYLTYDLGLSLEKKINALLKPDIGIPEGIFGFFNSTVIIDHLKKLLYIFSSGFPEKKYYLAKLLAESNLKKLQGLLYRASSLKDTDDNIKTASGYRKLRSNFSKEDYCLAVEKAKEYIRCGDIYQVNLSQRFQAKIDSSAFAIYRRLRQVSPSAFGAYFDAGDFQILSSSPERFLQLQGKRVVTRPMKGTRPRAKCRKKDEYLKRELLNNPKDKAELIMIVDLERNDLGKVCNYDSIKVTQLRQLEKYSTVYQTTATVEGELHKDKDRIDLLRACFPGGSITGCPKIRAMEIIDELEPQRRSIYTGILGYLSFCGNMDFNILIRTILKKDNQLYFGAGGGIVADSRPEDEYEETLVKARGMISAICKE